MLLFNSFDIKHSRLYFCNGTLIIKKPSKYILFYKNIKILFITFTLKNERDRKRNVKFVRIVIEEEIFEVNTNTSPSLVTVPMGCYLDTATLPPASRTSAFRRFT